MASCSAQTLHETMETAVREHQSGELDRAEFLYRQVLDQNPDHEDALHLLGLIAFQRNRYELALKLISEAIHHNPFIPYFHNNLGNVYKSLGTPDAAIESYRRAVHLKPDYTEAYYNLAAATLSSGDPHSAVQCCLKIIDLAPDSTDAFFLLGAAYEQQNANAKAADAYRSAIRLKPDHVKALNNLGIILNKEKNIQGAEECFRKAIRVLPDCPESHFNLGNIHLGRNRFDDAIGHYRNALLSQKDYFDAFYNMGIAFKALGRFQKAVRAFDSALRIHPENARAHLQRAFTLLLSGDYREGWKEYEWRFQAEGIAPRTGSNVWDGSPLNGKTILVDSEQGFGDMIQFVRYLPLVKARGGKVIFRCPRALFRLLSGFSGIDRIIEKKKDGCEDTPFDAYIPLLSLPKIFDTTPDTIPPESPYIHADPALREKWGKRVSWKAFNVGLVWGSGPKFPRRDCPLNELAPLAGIRGIEFYSLQKGPAAAQALRPPENMPLRLYTDELDDFSETAALIANLDLIISVDTSVAHLAGAMGKEVWTLLPTEACWRYHYNTPKTPWYPTMRLFRQPGADDWRSVVRAVLRELTKFLPEKPRRP